MTDPFDHLKARMLTHYNEQMGSTAADLRQTLIEAAFAAGARLLDRFRSPQIVRPKGGKDFTTVLDSEVETLIRDHVRQRFPSHCFLGEEHGASGRADHLWIMDPIDGTFNYTFGIPFFGTSIAVAHKGELLLGCAFDPIHREFFFAQKGHGAWRNDERIGVSNRAALGDALIALDLHYDVDRALDTIATMRHLFPHARSLRALGCAVLGLSYVACGRIDAYVHNALHLWDWSAGRLLVEEAGGRATDFAGCPLEVRRGLQSVVAASASNHGELLSLTSLG